MASKRHKQWMAPVVNFLGLLWVIVCVACTPKGHWYHRYPADSVTQRSSPSSILRTTTSTRPSPFKNGSATPSRRRRRRTILQHFE